MTFTWQMQWWQSKQWRQWSHKSWQKQHEANKQSKDIKRLNSGVVFNPVWLIPSQGAQGTTAAAEFSDDETLTEDLIQVLQDIITEEDMRDVDRVFRLNITRNDGADMETFFINMKPG